MKTSAAAQSSAMGKELPDLSVFANAAVAQTSGWLLNVSSASPIKRAFTSFQKVADRQVSDPITELKRARHEISYARNYYIPHFGKAKSDGPDVGESEVKAYEVFRVALDKLPEFSVD